MSGILPSEIVFDLDGTLLDHNSAARDAVLNWCSDQVPTNHRTPDAIMNAWARFELEYFPRFTRKEITFEEQRRFRIDGMLAYLGVNEPSAVQQDFQNYLDAYENAWKPFDDVIDVLTTLKAADYKLYIFTNGHLSQQYRKVNAIGVAHLISGMITSSELSYSKPHADAFREAWERLGLRPASGIYVGDDLQNDALGAAMAGIKSVWIDRENAGDTLESNISRVTSLEKILDLPEFGGLR